MPPLMEVARQLTPFEENKIGCHLLDAGQKRYVYGPNDDNTPVLSYVFIDKRIVIAAGAKKMIAKMQEILLKKDAEASNGGDDMLKFKEKLKSF